MAIHHPSTAFIPRTINLGINSFDRYAIECQIEELIALLDLVDGDPDLEDDDPSGDPLDRGEMPCDGELLAMKPVYGDDQTLGPINEYEAKRARDVALYGADYQ